jgi:calcium-dependent protein kinase
MAKTCSQRKAVEQDFVVAPDRVLGTGCSGSVVVAVDRRSGAERALKTYRKRDLSTRALTFLRNEVTINAKLHHPHVANLSGVYENSDTLSLVMELCPGGEVYTRLKQRGVFSEWEAVHAAHQMLLAIEHLHLHNIVHRDLKLENWLYSEAGDDADLKLIDFGFSTQWDSSTMMTDDVGTTGYMAPEVLRGRYSDKCDMWSFGVIIFALLSGRMPFQGKSCEETHRRILDCDYSLPTHVSDSARDFIEQLLIVDVSKRMSATQCLSHPWVAAVQCANLWWTPSPKLAMV